MERWSSGTGGAAGVHADRPADVRDGDELALVGVYTPAGELAPLGRDYTAAYARYQCELDEVVRKADKFATAHGLPGAEVTYAGVDGDQVYGV